MASCKAAALVLLAHVHTCPAHESVLAHHEAVSGLAGVIDA
jgi:hypothetical protein